MKYYLGIDLGTSAIKISLANEKGEIIDSSSKDYPLLLPHINWSEQNPEDWYEALLIVLQDLSLRNDLSLVSALSFSGQMHGLVLLDDQDKVIRPAILWNDSRVVDEVDYLNNKIGKDFLIDETGNIALCGFTAPKILWIKNNEPENFAKISKIMLPKDYLAYKLSGVFASDVSDLSGTLLFDVKRGQYSKKILNILGITESQLPKIYNSYETIGKVKKEFAEKCHLNKDCKVVIGGGDQAVGATGTNTIASNNISISLGTSGVVFAPVDKYCFDKNGLVHSFRHTTGNFHLMGCTLSAMGSLKRFLEDILKTTNYDEELNEMSDDISDIIFLPYLMGERSPINDPKATGYFSNLRLVYKREDLVKAVVEGICFSLYDVLNVMKENGITASVARVIGGGTKSDKFMQILADIFGMELRTITTKDGGALGAIILAMVGDGLYCDINSACLSLVHDKKYYYPINEKHEIYNKKFAKYKELYNKVKQ